MIRLTGSSDRVFRVTVSHTGSDGGTIHYINHDLDVVRVIPDLVFVTHNSPVIDYFFNGGSNYGYVLRYASLNYCEIRMFRWFPAGIPGTDQLATADLEISLRPA